MRKNLFVIAALLLAAPAFAQYHAYEMEAQKPDHHEAYVPTYKSDGSAKRPLNVILMIGDGMGLATLASAMYVNDYSLSITNLKYCGFSRTQSANAFTTDSAASGTAYSTGHKTNNGMVGMLPDGTAAANLPEKLSELGYISGVISTDNVSGATPAAFFAHQKHRSMDAEIWADLGNSKLSFISAGSIEAYDYKSQEVKDAILTSFIVSDDLSTVDPAAVSRLAYLPKENEVAGYGGDFKRGNFLPSTTRYAIDFLSSKAQKGFFLMVEGAHIDHAAHGNDADAMVREVLDFDQAVAEALRFADEDGHTLVIVTADHETGGPVLDYADDDYAKIVYTTWGHTPMMVPLFAYGPCAQNFIGVQENSDVSNKIFELLSKKK